MIKFKEELMLMKKTLLDFKDYDILINNPNF